MLLALDTRQQKRGTIWTAAIEDIQLQPHHPDSLSFDSSFHLMMWVYIAIAAGGLLAWYVITAIQAWYPLRKFQGPFTASFSYLWLLKADLSGERYKWVHHWQHRLGAQSPLGTSLIRIGPNLLCTDDPDILRRMNSARSKYSRGGWYDAVRLHPDNPSMMGSRDTEWHDDIKAKASFGYSGREIPGLERDVDKQIGGLKRYIRAKTGKDVDFASAAQYFALDVISKIAFGKEFGFLEADGDTNGYIAAMDVMAPVLSLCADVPWLRAIILKEWVFQTFGPKVTDKKGPGRIMGLAKEAVDERFEGGVKDQPDMLGSFLRHGITRSQCEAEGVLQITAGSDTTANVIRAIMLYISTSPTVYRKLQQEVDDTVASGKASSPTITSAETKTLPYLQAVLQEGLRIHPPSLILASKQVPPEGDTINGVFIPGGTEIAQNSWSLLRNKWLFGEDADAFRPERWLKVDGEKRAEMERISGLLFGHGRWMCAGKSIAFMELGKVFFELFRDFDFQIVNPAEPWAMEQHSIFVIKKMMMRITERKG